jgi:autotransporter-associated beta strand protein
MRRLSVSALLLFLAASSQAATRTWGGSTNGQWSVASNWDFGILPVAGDTLHFEPGGLNLNNTNDFPAGTAFAAIIVDGAGYVLNGNQVVLDSLTVNVVGSVTVNLPIQLANPSSFSVTFGTLTLGSPVDLNGNSLTVSVAVGSSIAQTGVISGDGSITKTGNGDWTLSAVNTFTGPVMIPAGRVLVANGSFLGVGDNTLGNATFVQPGGTLTLLGVSLGNEYVQIDGTGESGNGVLQSPLPGGAINATLEMGNTAAMNVVAPGTLTFNGPITGPGRFGMNGNGTYTINSSNNNFGGPVVWGPTSVSTATLVLGGTNSLPTTISLAIPSGATLNVNGQSQTIASLFGAGSVNLGSGGTLTIAQVPPSTYSGALFGTGTVIHSGAQLTFTGVSTYNGTYSNLSGITSLVGGTLPVPYTQTGGDLGVASGGTIGNVTINAGQFRPGLGGTGIANTGSLTMAPLTNYAQFINGPAAALFSNVHVTGTVALGGATFSLSGTGVGVASGNTFTIIDNDGIDPVIGTFAGLAQGAIIGGGPGGFSYVVSYIGGTGNDVVLTAVAPSGIPTLDPRALIALAFVLGMIAVLRR